ncbi:DNA-binding transcriptional dual regulator (fragment) [Candidatus Sulfotelmatobacter sp. SbA7]
MDGFDTKAGLFTPNLLECEVNRVMVEITHRTIAVCDSSKFGRRSLCNIMPVTAVHEVITDKQIAKADLYALKEAGIRVTLV